MHKVAQAIVIGIFHVASAGPVAAKEPRTIPINRHWDVLSVAEGPPDPRALFRQAGDRLGAWTVYIDAVAFNAKRLHQLAGAAPDEPFLRVVREAIRRPLDVDDFLYFLDDVLAAGQTGLRGQLVWLPASRARRAGILIHPDDVFWDDRPRLYGAVGGQLEIDKPARPTRLPAAKDGELLGPRWWRRYPNPSGRANKLAALDKKNPSGFSNRLRSLMKQLADQRATVLLYSTVRDPRRGYLMWGAFMLSRQTSAQDLDAAVGLLEKRSREWQRLVPIRWRHPKGWRATVEAARRMADAYLIAYASEEGARASKHYDGVAADLNVFGLPRSLTLKALDGHQQTFNLSDPQETRDLSLSPQIITWVERHFQFKKLREDYPHWDDANPVRTGSLEPNLEPCCEPDPVDGGIQDPQTTTQQPPSADL